MSACECLLSCKRRGPAERFRRLVPRTQGGASAGPSGKGIAAVTGKLIGVTGAKGALRGQASTKAQYQFDRCARACGGERGRGLPALTHGQQHLRPRRRRVGPPLAAPSALPAVLLLAAAWQLPNQPPGWLCLPRPAPAASPACSARRLQGNQWSAGVNTNAVLEGSLGSYLARSQRSPNIPLLQQPPIPQGIIAGRRLQQQPLVPQGLAAGRRLLEGRRPRRGRLER